MLPDLVVALRSGRMELAYERTAEAEGWRCEDDGDPREVTIDEALGLFCCCGPEDDEEEAPRATPAAVVVAAAADDDDDDDDAPPPCGGRRVDEDAVAAVGDVSLALAAPDDECTVKEEADPEMTV
jgi:hypothetical protein